MTTDIERSVLDHLRASHEPLREFALYDRVATDLGDAISPDTFVSSMERLMTSGRVHVIADRDPMRADPAPFQPRYYRVVE